MQGLSEQFENVMVALTRISSTFPDASRIVELATKNM